MLDLWFPTPIYSAMLPKLNNQAMKGEAYRIEKDYRSDHKWDCDTYSSINYDMRSNEAFSNLFMETAQRVAEFAIDYGKKRPQTQLVEAWVNISRPGNYQEYHVHPGSHFSAVYYVDAPQDCGNIVFRNPMSDVDMLPIQGEETTHLGFDVVKYEPRPSRLLIFRSFVRHMVLKNRSDSDRISIAMNWRV